MATQKIDNKMNGDAENIIDVIVECDSHLDN